MLKVIDFGLAKKFSLDTQQQQGQVGFRGSSAYASVNAHKEVPQGERFCQCRLKAAPGPVLPLQWLRNQLQTQSKCRRSNLSSAAAHNAQGEHQGEHRTLTICAQLSLRRIPRVSVLIGPPADWEAAISGL